ncbi:unnamed protein product [Bursaphelenchus xylophilus]|uniref:(pine wood nematode) hypothetical protein n=1 Tax=Bursaphelenchus xylophilus TaxID=6326 RepID=A0A1I7SQJ2_BURXY|nr:unnamed protein product [Bursaphelenchus xylophilus]CAG9109982.1 unnamed protein product [Bursaphelenchus xylophilus]
MDLVLLIDIFNDVFGITLPVFAIILVLRRTPSQHVRVYSRMLIASCILDIIYTITNIVSMITLIFAERKVFFIIRNQYLWPYHLAWTCALLAHLYCIFVSIILIPIQFMYRYKVVTSTTTSYTVLALLYYRHLCGNASYSTAIYVSNHC